MGIEMQRDCKAILDIEEKTRAIEFIIANA
jgi:hypothetical protein